MSEIIESYRYENFEAWKVAITKGPPASLIKTRGLGGSKQSSYQPIEVTEALADMMFREWNVSDEKYFNIINEIVCTVKITALPDYPGADYMVFTGTASKPVTVDKGSDLTQFPKGKKANALQYNMPAVRSDAIGCAFETKGNLFGRNISRESTNDFGFDVSYEKEE
jgi:hypothetical protein